MKTLSYANRPGRTAGMLMRGLVAVWISLVNIGCSGMVPFEYRNHREEGPSGGAFSGDQGEFVIYRNDSTKAEKDSLSTQSGDEEPTVSPIDTP